MFKIVAPALLAISAMAALPCSLALEKPKSLLRDRSAAVAHAMHEDQRKLQTGWPHDDKTHRQLLTTLTENGHIADRKVGSADQVQFGWGSDISRDGTTFATVQFTGTEKGTFVYTVSTDGITHPSKGAPIPGNSQYPALNADGTVVASCQNNCKVYSWDGTTWTQKGNTVGTQYYRFVKLSDDGNTFAANMGQNGGETHVFTYDSANNVWNPKGSPFQGRLGPNPLEPLATGYKPDLGTNAANELSGDGNTIIMGAPTYGEASGLPSHAGTALVYRWDGTQWNKIGQFVGTAADDFLGQHVSISQDGNTVVIGATFGNTWSGKVYTYQYSGDGSDCGSSCTASWTDYGVIDSAGLPDGLGFAVEMSSNGQRITAIGRYDTSTESKRTMRVYDRTSGAWTKEYEFLTVAFKPAADASTYFLDYRGGFHAMSGDGKYVVSGSNNDAGNQYKGSVAVWELTPVGGGSGGGPAPAPGPSPSANQCDNKSYCVAFKEVSSTLGGTGEDITITYDASKPIDSINSYQTTILKSDCQPFASTPTPAVSVVANSYTYTGTSTPSTMSLSLDIDTANIENQSELSTVSSDPNKFDVSFCVKTELMYTDTVVSSTPIEVASSKTVLTLTVDKAKSFQFSISAAQEATGSKAADVTVSYPLLRCVCALGANTPTVTNGVAQCLTSYGDLNPGATFKFCIQAVNDDTNPTAVLTEVEVEALKDVNFENDGDGSGALNPALTVPIVGGTATSTGPGAGPASVDCTSTAGLCVVTAVTFAKLYEANIDSDAALEDISDHNKVKGTAILTFKRRRHLGSGSAQEEKESIEVGFAGSSAAVRQLQADDGTPVDEFAMDVSLASPPDRSAAVVAGSSPALAFVSLMMGGLLGLIML